MYNNTMYDLERKEKENEARYNREYEEILKDSKKNLKYMEEYDESKRQVAEAEERKNREFRKKLEYDRNKKSKELKKQAIKKVLKTGSLIALIGIGTDLIIGKIEEYKYQKDIDNSITEDYEESYNRLEDERKNKITQDTYQIDKNQFSNYLAAVEILKKYGNEEINYNSELYEQVEDAKAIIEDYTKNGGIIRIATNTIEAKLENAKKYGDYTGFDLHNGEDIEIEYVNDVQDGITGFRIEGMRKGMYFLKGATILDKDIPGNLEELTKDVFDYRKKEGKWKNSEECIEFGIEVGEDLGRVLQEQYILDEEGYLLRINEKDYTQRKEQYEKEQIEKKRISDEKAVEILTDIIL